MVLVAAWLLSGCHDDAASADTAPWAKAFGDDADQSQIAIAVNEAGDVVLAGALSARLDLGGGPITDDPLASNDIFVGELDPSGKHRWSVGTGSDGSQLPMSVAFDPRGNVLVTGMFENEIDFGDGPIDALTQDIFLASFDDRGRFAWAKHFSADDGGPSGAGTSSANAVAVGGDGNIIIAGTFTGTLGFGGKPIDTPKDGQSGFVAKLDPSGEHIYSIVLQPGDLSVRGLAVDMLGAATVVGITGSNIGGAGFITRLDPDGSPSWRVGLIGTVPPSTNAVALDLQGNTFVGGCFTGDMVFDDRTVPGSSNVTGFVAKVAPDGTTQWIKTLDRSCVTALDADAIGHIHVGGQYIGAPKLAGRELPHNGLGAAFVAVLDPVGTIVEASALGHAGNVSIVTSVAVAGDHVVVAGNFDGQLDTPVGTLSSLGFRDFFVARLP
ncbi:Hypothetical protein A7982_06430 [Minicystis rosea]|nr:Hypothetical protein A7982_06430 [Minicystis rosea]